MNIPTLTVLLIVALLFVLSMAYQIKNKNTCGLGCSHCKSCRACSNNVNKETV